MIPYLGNVLAKWTVCMHRNLKQWRNIYSFLCYDFRVEYNRHFPFLSPYFLLYFGCLDYKLSNRRLPFTDYFYNNWSLIAVGTSYQLSSSSCYLLIPKIEGMLC